MGKAVRKILGVAAVIAIGYAVYKLAMGVVDELLEQDEKEVKVEEKNENKGHNKSGSDAKRSKGKR